MAKVVLGIDPGLKGGLCVLSKEHGLLELKPMPVIGRDINTAELREMIKRARFDFGAEVAVIEKVHSMPGQGLSSTFTFGKGYGILIGQVSMLGMDFELVSPQKWQSIFHNKENSKTPKQRSLEAAEKLFPLEDFLASDRSRVPHDGLVDAALIAQWGILEL